MRKAHLSLRSYSTIPHRLLDTHRNIPRCKALTAGDTSFLILGNISREVVNSEARHGVGNLYLFINGSVT